jgi:outer membrane protein assembly factor BamB
MKTLNILLLLFFFTLFNVDRSNGQNWPQFRGQNGSGVADEKAKPPVEFNESKLVWKTDLPEGFSSPVIWGNKIFLTGCIEEKKELTTFCLDRKSGKILWQKSLFPDTLEKHSAIANSAQSTVSTDGERVVVYFGSCGLICYNINGEEQWTYPRSCVKYSYGNATSPIIEGNKVIFLDDEGVERYLLALDKTNGKEIWRTPYKSTAAMGQGGHATPCIYKEMVMTHKGGEIAAYSLKDGSIIWNHRILTEASGSPVMAGNKVIVNCWLNVSDEAERPVYPGYEEVLAKYDSDKNGKINSSELSDTLMVYVRKEFIDIKGGSASVKSWFGTFDKNKDKEIEMSEWDATIKMLKDAYYKPSGLIALNADSRGTLKDSAVLWRVSKNISEVPSPIYYNERVFMIKDGGVMTCINPETGKILYQESIGGPGPYLASPVAANGLIYVFGYNGKLKIIEAGDKLKVVGMYDLKDNVAATPAIMGNSIYIRTKTGLRVYSD